MSFEQFTKCPILHDICPKNIFPNFGANAPLPPSPTSMVSQKQSPVTVKFECNNKELIIKHLYAPLILQSIII